MKKNKRIGTIFCAVGLVLMAAALALTLYNRWDADRADKAAQTVVTQLETRIPARREVPQIPAPAETPTEEEPTAVEIDGNIYIGILEIPSLSLELPVMTDWSYPKLKIAPCRYHGSCDTDDLVIAGHNYASHFSPLKWIALGSDVYFTEANGTVIHYTVDNVETLQPTQLNEMVTGDWDLTLFTCTTGGKSRCTVRCIRAAD